MKLIDVLILAAVVALTSTPARAQCSIPLNEISIGAAVWPASEYITGFAHAASNEIVVYSTSTTYPYDISSATWSLGGGVTSSGTYNPGTPIYEVEVSSDGTQLIFDGGAGTITFSGITWSGATINIPHTGTPHSSTAGGLQYVYGFPSTTNPGGPYGIVEIGGSSDTGEGYPGEYSNIGTCVMPTPTELGNDTYAEITLSAATGSETSVDFYVDGTLVGSATSSPFNYTYSPDLADGPHSLAAVGTFTNGEQSSFTSYFSIWNYNPSAGLGGQSCWGNAAYCWGSNSTGQLGDNTTTNRDYADYVYGIPSDAISQMAGGGAATCALVDAGVQCWGDNTYGELGNNSTASSDVPVEVYGVTQAQALGMGSTHACAIVDGGAMCWGGNADGELGNNSTTGSLVPVQVTGLTTGVMAIAVGNHHSCAIQGDAEGWANGKVYCWGDNTYGQLGNNTTVGSLVPVFVENYATWIAAGDGHSCAASVTDGTYGDNAAAYCWGDNANGQLGNNSTITQSLVPVQVYGLDGSSSSVTSITAGTGYSCANVDGAPQCWGANVYGQLGNNSTMASSIPVAVYDWSSGAHGISAGSDHTCMMANAGHHTPDHLYCWGNNSDGQLGNGSTTNSLIPVNIELP